jgi:hypothetical protein
MGGAFLTSPRVMAAQVSSTFGSTAVLTKEEKNFIHSYLKTNHFESTEECIVAALYPFLHRVLGDRLFITETKPWLPKIETYTEELDEAAEKRLRRTPEESIHASQLAKHDKKPDLM